MQENGWLDRTEKLIGREAIKKLAQSRIAVIGLGGVGGNCAEGLARAGVGQILVIDHDIIDSSNRNRQLFATAQTIGKQKSAVAVERLSEVCPECTVTPIDMFYSSENRETLFNWNPDFVIDAMDTVTAKLDLIATCTERNIPVLSCMGTGNRLDPTAFRVGDIAETAGCGCGLAKVMRRELRRRGILSLPVVYSLEEPLKAQANSACAGRHSPASISFCPPVAGYILASYAVRYLIGPIPKK